MSARAAHYGAHHERARAVLLELHPWCQNGDGRPSAVADHDPPIALHKHIEGTGCCSYRATCIDCSRRQGADVAAVLRAQRNEPAAPAELQFIEPDPSPGPADSVWDSLPWLDQLRDVPTDGAWPRFMTGPHPNAVGSLLDEFEAFILERDGGRLLWFQRLTAARLLEVDKDGHLVWLHWFLTVARQSGKSYLVTNLLLFALTRSKRLWPLVQSDVLYTSRTLLSAESLVRGLLNWARDAGDPWHANRTNGAKGVTWNTDYALLIRAIDSVYGETCGLVVIDEAWDVAQSSVDESVEPATLMSGGQVGYTSTAHRRAVSTCLRLRATGLTSLEVPDALLLLEWSSAPWRERDDEEGWHEASPHWTEHRRRRILSMLERAHSGVSMDPTEPDPLAAFDAQVLNRWPLKAAVRHRSDRLLSVEAWQSCRGDVETAGPVVVAIEDYIGHGAAAAAVGRARDGRWVIGGWCFPARPAAYRWAAGVMADRPSSQLVVGQTLRGDPQLPEGVPIHAATGTETRAGLALLRTLILEGLIVNDGSPDLAQQVEMARVVETATGLTLLRGPRADLVKAAIWALRQAVNEPALEPAVSWPRSA